MLVLQDMFEMLDHGLLDVSSVRSVVSKSEGIVMDRLMSMGTENRRAAQNCTNEHSFETIL